MKYLLSEKEQIDCWCDLQTVPVRGGKIAKPFRDFSKGTALPIIQKWIAENGPYNVMQLDYEYLIRPAKEDIDKHPYLKYRGVGFQVEPFIEMARKYPANFTNYCEIVMTENGIIYLASPSHSCVEERLKMKGFKNLCSIWYALAIAKNLTPAQRKNIERLKEAGLLSQHLYLNSDS